MAVHLDIRNESAWKRLHHTPALRRIAETVCRGESASDDVELSVLLCDDPFIADLNQRYRKKNRPTDVLSFEQDGPADGTNRTLGDIVISLETVERRCGGDRALMRAEVRLLFCHGLLHLLGYDHATQQEEKRMAGKQAEYLGLTTALAWCPGPPRPAATAHPS